MEAETSSLQMKNPQATESLFITSFNMWQKYMYFQTTYAYQWLQGT